ncbi:Muskelin N-terminus-domain-containing protein [Suillus clintonianus]|uniref:Muskelin N-terminus-domain-containing protein n=1 Tax=Suillus clintonianus TaxID=1904413 RepID=UPI001B87E449|nr:Muskelin N-terminus-domain-containing protein [Suillus clintonianus]KAG2135782.1 Muskelin N-terminus-domain-containing protein [Suillus clintonianus]
MMSATWATSSQPTMPPAQAMTYAIAGCSEHSGNYVPENILVDTPQDPTSRWSGAQQLPTAKQWIMLKLETLSVIKSITFGKFHRKHPCNMREFRVYVGLNPHHMVQALHTQLKDDTVYETFPLKHVNSEGIYFPTRFIKIVPVSAHGMSFHISIWYVSISGTADPLYIDNIRSRYEEYRETVVLRHVLKHLRQRRLLTPYQNILARSNIQVEHPIVTALHSSLVLQGNWTDSETRLLEASSAGLLDAYIQFCQPHSQWKRLHGVDADGDAPSKRGGHAMALDPENGLIYLLGGWDGQKSLDDFWVYDVTAERWRVISHSTSAEKNGPIARSCHKMVYDTKSGCIYLLGRLGDGDILKPEEHQELLRRAGEIPDGSRSTPYCSEFFRYHTRGLDVGKWDLLSFDTAASGGPPLIFDHQMVMDCEAQILYVSGGRVVDGDWDSPKYSGMYSYNVRTSKWKLLQPQPALSMSSSVQPPISPRFGHSMVLDTMSHTLFIFAGQRDDKYLSDMYAYDIASNTVTELFSNFSTSGGPDACFTQRAIIDGRLKEIYVFCGLTRAQPASALTSLRADTPNWVYQYTHPSKPGKWTKILPEPIQEGGEPVEVPLPRYAHQVVYDEGKKRVFMHGGNAGEVSAPAEDVEPEVEASGDEERPRSGEEDRPSRVLKETRLDDFWTMKLLRAAHEEIIRRAKYQIRQQQFREMCEEQPAVKALRFLQTEVSAVVDHKSPEETSVFRALLGHLFSTPITTDDSSTESTGTPKDDTLEEPPKKRSRPNTPDEAWTSRLDDEDDDEMPGASTSATVASSGQKRRYALLSMEEDPEETALRDASTKPLSPERFRQRTEVFESLLQFVGEDGKQPMGSLLDMVDAEDGI